MSISTGIKVRHVHPMETIVFHGANWMPLQEFFARHGFHDYDFKPEAGIPHVLMYPSSIKWVCYPGLWFVSEQPRKIEIFTEEEMMSHYEIVS